MANEENLMAHRIREPEEARQKGKSGGRKSGEVRRRKKAFRDAATDIIRTVITDPMLLEKVSKQGYEKENMTYQVDTYISADTFGVRWEKGIAVKENGFEMLSPEIPQVCPELLF